LRGSEADVWPVLWWPVFVVTQLVAFGVVLGLDPAGLDPCGTEGAGPRPLQTAIAGVSLLGCAGLALWRLRRWSLVAAFVAVGLAIVPWLWLLGDSQASC
jgi:hypothetical protein